MVCIFEVYLRTLLQVLIVPTLLADMLTHGVKERDSVAG